MEVTVPAGYSPAAQPLRRVTLSLAPPDMQDQTDDWSRLQTALRVVLPAAFSGVAAAFVLGMSRAVGETMVVAIAAGQQPNLTLNPTEPAATITAYIVQVALGDLPHGSIGYQTIFAAGLTLLLITLAFNLLAFTLRRRLREAY